MTKSKETIASAFRNIHQDPKSNVIVHHLYGDRWRVNIQTHDDGWPIRKYSWEASYYCKGNDKGLYCYDSKSKKEIDLKV